MERSGSMKQTQWEYETNKKLFQQNIACIVIKTRLYIAIDVENSKTKSGSHYLRHTNGQVEL